METKVVITSKSGKSQEAIITSKGSKANRQIFVNGILIPNQTSGFGLTISQLSYVVANPEKAADREAKYLAKQERGVIAKKASGEIPGKKRKLSKAKGKAKAKAAKQSKAPAKFEIINLAEGVIAKQFENGKFGMIYPAKGSRLEKADYFRYKLAVCKANKSDKATDVVARLKALKATQNISKAAAKRINSVLEVA